MPGAGENAKLGEIGRESRIVSLGGRLALELPDIASIAQAADIVPESAVATIAVIALVRPNKVIRAGMIAHCGLRDRASVIVVAPSFAEQKNVFMRAGRAVADRFGHRVGLGPNYIGAQIPAVGLKGEGHAPGNADKVLGLEARMVQPALARARAPIRIPENEPQDAVVTEHAAHLAEDVDQSGNVLLRRRLKTDLAPAALIIAQLIIAQLKIWRAGHNALDGLIPQWNFKEGA